MLPASGHYCEATKLDESARIQMRTFLAHAVSLSTGKSNAALARRIGHLDPDDMCAEPELLREAFRAPSALPRYVENVPRCS